MLFSIKEETKFMRKFFALQDRGGERAGSLRDRCDENVAGLKINRNGVCFLMGG